VDDVYLYKSIVSTKSIFLPASNSCAYIINNFSITKRFFNFMVELWKRRGGSFGEGPIEYDEVELPIAYERVLRTWAKWVEENVDPKHSSVCFSSMSPTHVRYTNLTRSLSFSTRLLLISYFLCSFLYLFHPKFVLPCFFFTFDYLFE